MTREEVIQLALDIGLRAARNYKYRGSLEAMTEPERKELEQLLEFANKIIQRDEVLLREALYALEYASDMSKPEDLQGCGCPVCTNIAALRERLNETCEHEPVLVETLLGDWQFCKHCNRPWTTEMEKAYVARTKPHYEPTPHEGSEP